MSNMTIYIVKMQLHGIHFYTVLYYCQTYTSTVLTVYIGFLFICKKSSQTSISYKKQLQVMIRLPSTGMGLGQYYFFMSHINTAAVYSYIYFIHLVQNGSNLVRLVLICDVFISLGFLIGIRI